MRVAKAPHKSRNVENFFKALIINEIKGGAGLDIIFKVAFGDW